MELVKENDTQRFYKLDFKVWRGAKWTISEHFEECPIRMKDRYKIVHPSPEYATHVCVSDSNRHIERLCFPAFIILDATTGKETLACITDTLVGKNTFLIHGGDPSQVYPDAVYIRSVAEAKMVTERLTTMLRQYQKDAVKFAMDHDNPYLAMECGLGKTLISLALIHHLKLKTLVVAPLQVARNTWPEEIETWVKRAIICSYFREPRRSY